RGQSPRAIERTPAGDAVRPSAPLPTKAVPELDRAPIERPKRLYPYAVSRDVIDKVLRELSVDARTVDRPDRADAVIALPSRADDGRLRRIVEATGLPVYLVRKNTAAQMRRLLQDVFALLPGSESDEVEDALGEAEAGADRAISEGVPVALSPRPPRLRRLQHRLILRRQLLAESIGSEPERHLVIHPRAGDAGGNADSSRASDTFRPKVSARDRCYLPIAAMTPAFVRGAGDSSAVM